MAKGSPRVTRARTKQQHNDSNDEPEHQLNSTESGDHSESDSAEIGEKSSGTHLYPNLHLLCDMDEEDQEAIESSDLNKSSTFTQEDKSSNSNFPLICGLVTALLALLAYWFMFESSSTLRNVSSASNTSGYELFERDVKVLESSFPSQTRRFWNTVSASARHVYYQQDPCYPSVILMAANNRNHNLNVCLAKKIGYAFSQSFGASVTAGSSDVGIDINDIKHLDPEHQKQELDDYMRLAFQKRGEKAFVISNIQHLAPKAALILHGFCDGDNAPYKDVMILLSFQVDDSVEFKSVKDVEGHLVNIWSKDLHMDKLSAIMSRIANNPVVVQPEEKGVVSEMCR